MKKPRLAIDMDEVIADAHGALNIVFCGDKSIVAADLLLDDTERHFERFQGQGVLFSAPHNQSSSWPVKVKDWGDAVAYLEAWTACSV